MRNMPAAIYLMAMCDAMTSRAVARRLHQGVQKLSLRTTHERSRVEIRSLVGSGAQSAR
jgi:hypothetical protein